MLYLTPGPLSTSLRTRQAMLQDWGSRDSAFTDLTSEVRRSLGDLAGGTAEHTVVLLQGSGTYGIESLLSTALKTEHKAAILVNGTYGERIAQIAAWHKKRHVVARWANTEAVDPTQLPQIIANDPEISHFIVVHCETSTGLINPLKEIAEVAANLGRRLFVDAMSTFGAYPIDISDMRISALVSSSNKCLEGVPGLSFIITERNLLKQCQGISSSISLDLYEQWDGFERNGQWRFTPPVQAVAALHTALTLLREEGGPAMRLRRYRENSEIVIEGLTKHEFSLLLKPQVQSAIIATFVPTDTQFEFPAFYNGLKQRGFAVYPAPTPEATGFRVGFIGALTSAAMHAFVDEVRRLRC